MLIGPPEVLYMQGLDSNAPLDIEKSLTPVTMLSSQPIVVAVNPQTGWRSIDAMMAAGRQKPDGLTYATPGPGGTNNIIAAMMFRRAGVKYLNIPYKGGGQAVQDLLSGVVPVGVLGSAPLMPHVQNRQGQAARGHVEEALGHDPRRTGAGRAGLPRHRHVAMVRGLRAGRRAGPVVERLSAAFQKALADPEVRAKLALAALEPLGGTPQDFSRRLRSEGETWLGTARKYGIGRT